MSIVKVDVLERAASSREATAEYLAKAQQRDQNRRAAGEAPKPKPPPISFKQPPGVPAKRAAPQAPAPVVIEKETRDGAREVFLDLAAKPAPLGRVAQFRARLAESSALTRWFDVRLKGLMGWIGGDCLDLQATLAYVGHYRATGRDENAPSVAPSQNGGPDSGIL